VETWHLDRGAGYGCGPQQPGGSRPGCGPAGRPRPRRDEPCSHPGDAPAPDFEEVQHVKLLEPGRLHRKEVNGQDLLGMLVNEVAPAEAGAPGSRADPVPPQDVANGQMRTGTAQFDQLALNASVAQRGFSRARRKTSSLTSAASLGRPRRRRRLAYRAHFRRTSSRCQRSSVGGVMRNDIQTGRGSRRLSAASSSRSLRRHRGGPTWRWSTRS
jgi:hypothetical protein